MTAFGRYAKISMWQYGQFPAMPALVDVSTSGKHRILGNWGGIQTHYKSENRQSLEVMMEVRSCQKHCKNKVLRHFQIRIEKGCQLKLCTKGSLSDVLLHFWGNSCRSLCQGLFQCTTQRKHWNYPKNLDKIGKSSKLQFLDPELLLISHFQSQGGEHHEPTNNFKTYQNSIISSLLIKLWKIRLHKCPK